MSMQLEKGIIADLLFNSSPEYLETLAESGVEPGHFADPRLAKVFAAVTSLRHDDGTRVADPECLYEAALRILDESELKGLAAHVGASLGDFAVRLKLLSDGAQSRRLNLGPEALKALEGVPLDRFVAPPSDDDNPNALIRTGWLQKGGAAFLTAPSGIGKSVIAMQLAFAWACGREMLRMRPVRPLKIAILQTEDGDYEMGQFIASMEQGLAKYHGWSAEEIENAKKRIVLHSTMGHTGADFARHLANIQLRERAEAREAYDLFIINPFLAVVGDDPTNNREMSRFLRHDLEQVISPKLSPETACGILFVHHTGKAPSPNERANFGADAYASYAGLGASEITNWMRASIVITHVEHEYGRFRMVGAKNGKKLGWPLTSASPKHPERRDNFGFYIRHNSPDRDALDIMFWHDDGPDAPNASAIKPADPLAQIRANAEKLAGEVRKEERTAMELREVARRQFGKNVGDSAYGYLKEHLADFGLIIDGAGERNCKVYRVKA